MGDGEDHPEVNSFLRDVLKLDESFLRCVGELKLERIPYGPKSKYKNEMLVRFKTVEARDIVRQAATNLVGRGQSYGIRLKIANHMKADMKALQVVSYDLKQRHPDARRNVLFDDDSLELVLDFSLREGAPWRRLTPGQAKMRKRKPEGDTSFRLGDHELDEILGAAAMESDDP